MSKFILVEVFSNAYCYTLYINGKKFPFAFREFDKTKAYEKGAMLGQALGVEVFGDGGMKIGE